MTDALPIHRRSGFARRPLIAGVELLAQAVPLAVSDTLSNRSKSESERPGPR